MLAEKIHIESRELIGQNRLLLDKLWKYNRAIAEILLNAETVRFDASDLMPPEVGAGTFWSVMTDLASGSITLDQAVTEIDASWPSE